MPQRGLRRDRTKAEHCKARIRQLHLGRTGACKAKRVKVEVAWLTIAAPEHVDNGGHADQRLEQGYEKEDLTHGTAVWRGGDESIVRVQRG